MLPDLHSALRRHFGFEDFRPGQAEAIEHALAGRPALVVMPTGAGKSLCYQLAALLLPGTALVVSPLIALMKDQVDRLTARGIPAAFINSAISTGEQRARLAGLAAGAYRLVYVAPERLRSRAFLEGLAAAKISLLAVDEAHCISHWGHDFRPDYLQIGPTWERLARDGRRPPVLALTATATPQVQRDILQRLGAAQAATIVTGFNRPNLAFQVVYTPNDKAKLRALRGVLDAVDGAGIIYAGTRRDAEEVAEFVSQVLGLAAPYYHAGLDADSRTRVQESFMAGATAIVVATNAFGMGIDRADLRFVVHYALPGTLEAYYQEAGRAGRDGLPSRCVLLYSPEDRALQEWFITADAPATEDVRRLHRVFSRAGGQATSFDLTEIARDTGLHDTKIRLALSHLESAGAVVRHGDDGMRVRLETGALSESSLKQIEADVAARRKHRLDQLNQMVQYAESDTCRRRTLLDHFGDSGDAAAELCCDVCLSQPAIQAQIGKAESDAHWVALLVLETVKLQKWNIGRSTLVKILKGSKAAKMERFDYARHKHFGRLDVFTRDEVGGLIDQLVQSGHLKVIGSKYPVLRLSPAGAAAVASRSAVTLSLPRKVSIAERDRARAKRDAGGTIAYTFSLLQNGLTPAQIATERGLSENTVLDHLAGLIVSGQVALESVVPTDVQTQIESALDRTEPALGLGAVKSQLPGSISYGQIRCVIANRDRAKGLPLPRRVASAGPPDLPLLAELRRWRAIAARERDLPPYAIFNDRTLREISARKPASTFDLLSIPGIGPKKAEENGQAVLQIVATGRATTTVPLESRSPADTTTGGQDREASPPPPPPNFGEEEDVIESFLTASRPKSLPGPWRAGLALDFHSRFRGDKWSRTEAGDMAYRFKYEGDESLAPDLARRLAKALRANPAFGPLDGLLAVPPSNPDRAFDPVTTLARAPWLMSCVSLPSPGFSSRPARRNPKRK